MKMKTYGTCGECPSCVDLLHTGKRYCNMKLSDGKDPQKDISTLELNPNESPKDCPLVTMNERLHSFGREDLLGLKFLAKMFSGGETDFLVEEESDRDYISRKAVLDILEKERELVNINWSGDEALLDMIVTIQDRVNRLPVY